MLSRQLTSVIMFALSLWKRRTPLLQRVQQLPLRWAGVIMRTTMPAGHCVLAFCPLACCLWRSHGSNLCLGAPTAGGRQPRSVGDRSQREAAERKTRGDPRGRDLWLPDTVDKQWDEYLWAAYKILTLLSYLQEIMARLMNTSKLISQQRLSQSEYYLHKIADIKSIINDLITYFTSLCRW